jgi:hypothetical protein
MKPGTYMIAGGMFGMVLTLICVFLPDVSPIIIGCVFSAGALFGKGYGVWEERSRIR